MIQTRIETVSILSQLNDELVIDYDTGSAGKAITQIVTDLLALQVSTNPITIGTIQPTVSRAISVQGGTILGALLKLRDTVGGYVSVDSDHKLNWMNNIGEDKGQQIRYRKNLIGITRTMDFANFGNRLYCYGAGEGDARIKLSDAEGQVEDYVEDAESQAIYGIIIRQLVDKSITHPDTLLAWANLKLAELKTPFISYRIDMVDLSERDVGFSFDALQLGSVVKVIDEDLGIDVEARIVKIRRRNLYDPEDIEIEISNHTKDVIDLLSEVYDRQQLDHHTAIRIGAGQVIVLGDFVVKDWVTADATTIKGGAIEASTITATQLIKTENLITQSIQIGDALITTVKIADLAVAEGKIDNLAVTTGKIANLAVTNAKIDTCSVSKLTAGSLTVQELLGTDGSVKTATSGERVEITHDGIRLWGSNNLKFFSTATYEEGNINATSGNFWLEAYPYDTNLNLKANDGQILLSCGASIILRPAGTTADELVVAQGIGLYPYTTDNKYLGSSANYWAGVYANTYYGKNTTIQSFQNRDDIGVLRGIRDNGGHLVPSTFPKELIETEEDMKQVLEAGNKEIEDLKHNYSLPSSRVNSEINTIEMNMRKSLAFPGINIMNWQSLLTGAILQLEERVKKLENN